MSTAKLQTAVMGATGYSGFELARLLVRHPKLAEPLFLRREGEESSVPLDESIRISRATALILSSRFHGRRCAAPGSACCSWPLRTNSRASWFPRPWRAACALST